VDQAQQQLQECLEPRKLASRSLAHQQRRQLLKQEACSDQPQGHRAEAYLVLLQLHLSHSLEVCLVQLLQLLNLKPVACLDQLQLHPNLRLEACLAQLAQLLSLKLEDYLVQLQQLLNPRPEAYLDQPLQHLNLKLEDYSVQLQQHLNRRLEACLAQQRQRQHRNPKPEGYLAQPQRLHSHRLEDYLDPLKRLVVASSVGEMPRTRISLPHLYCESSFVQLQWITLTQNSGSAAGTNQSQQPQQSSLFPSLGQSQAQSGTGLSGLGGGLTMGQANQQAQTVPGVKIDITNLRGTTRFNDLHEELQKQIEHMDNVIQGQIQLKNECYAIMPSHDSQLSNIPIDVEFCRRKLIGLESAMAADAEAIAHIREFVKADAESAKLSFRAIDNLKLPPQYHVSGVWPSKSTTGDNRSRSNNDGEGQDLVGFFSSNADELAATLSKYQKHIGEIELHLRSVEESSAQQINALIARRNGGSGGDDDQLRQLAAALADFEQSIVHIASKVGNLREGVTALQQYGAFRGPAHGRSMNGHRSGIY
jgi:hypothetical protein